MGLKRCARALSQGSSTARYSLYWIGPCGTEGYLCFSQDESQVLESSTEEDKYK